MEKKNGYTIIKDWSQQDRPREKLLTHGTGQLSDAELLAIILGSGYHNTHAVDLARRILAEHVQSLDKLSKASAIELMQFNGVGKAKAASILAAIEFGKRSIESQPSRKPCITKSKDGYKILRPILRNLEHEEFWVLYLNNANYLLAKHQLSKGGITATLVDIRLAIKKALEVGAVAMILAHNHPSGKLIPSRADKQLTAKMKKAAQSMDLRVLDHLILSDSSYFSFADQNLI